MGCRVFLLTARQWESEDVQGVTVMLYDSVSLMLMPRNTDFPAEEEKNNSFEETKKGVEWNVCF
jgi:hypothetical protein